MSKILKPSDLDDYPAKNAQGEWATYIQGDFMGYAKMVNLVSVGRTLKCPEVIHPILLQMVADAKKDGIDLTISKCFVTLTDQIGIRQFYLKEHDAHRSSDLAWLLSAPTTSFKVEVGLPGWSNHQNVKTPAVDFNVTGLPKVYAWLVKNAIKYGFIRTVVTERWHWEYRPGAGMFDKVPKTHPTWDNLV